MTARGLCIGPDGIPDASASGVPWLVHLLDGVFGPVATRPDAAELLRRLGHDDVLTDLPRPEHDGLAEGHAAYDHLMALKDPRRIPPARQVPSPTAPAPDTAP
ncbi:hypothetical protein [Frankia canadensis]|uniref:hypothetical protein n=1 Tax=Frankia canadensis TaxID=1836972 RepID=UPI001054C06E|nr:hypothetical protein [Frankia canadensis]